MLFWYRKGLLDKIFGQLNSSDLAQNCDLLELILSVADEIRMASVPKLQISSCNMLIRCLNGFGQESAVALRILLKLCESTLIDQNDLATFDMEVACLIDDPSRILTYDLANDEAGSVAQLIEYGEIRRFGSSGQYDQQFTKFKSQLQLLNYKRIPSNNAQSDQALLAKIISLCAHLKQSRTIEDIEQLIEENERLKTKVGDITVEMEMNAHDFAEFRASFNREMDISKQDIETLKKTCETLKSDLDALHSQHFELQNDRNRLAADLNVINSQFADSIEKLRGLQAELDREKNATLAFHVKAQITEDDMVNLQNELAKREIELLKRDNEIQILNEDIQKSNQMGDRLQSLVDGLQAENLKLSDSNEQFIREAKIRSTAERLEKTKLFAQHEETIGQLQVRINQLQMELETKALCERNLKSDMKIAASCIEQKDRTNQQLSSELQQLLEELQRGRKCDPHQMDEENMADFSNLSLDIDLK
jgi:DNA repair exonuclease SbcCD ATPase subunit